MSAIEACRTAALGGHVERCVDCGLVRIAYNSCRNRHCPKCQGPARAAWLADRQAELLPVPYFHVVSTLPVATAEIAFQNKAAVYGILFRAAAETLSTIAADPEAVLAYLGRYTHRVAIANSRLVALAGDQVSFRWRDYRHHNKNKVMTLAAEEFIRRFLLHALPDGFHRIRHYGFLANCRRDDKLALCRKLLDEPARAPARDRPECQQLAVDRCPCCGGRMEPVGIVLRTTTADPLAGYDSS